MIYIIQKNGKDYESYYDKSEALADMELANETEEDTFTLVEVDEDDCYEQVSRPMYA